VHPINTFIYSLCTGNYFNDLVETIKLMMTTLGRYNKYSRELPQTPWVIDGEKKVETSVEELILGELKSLFKFDQVKYKRTLL